MRCTICVHLSSLLSMYIIVLTWANISSNEYNVDSCVLLCPFNWQKYLGFFLLVTFWLQVLKKCDKYCKPWSFAILLHVGIQLYLNCLILQVNIMHIYLQISKMAKEGANVSIAMKCEIACGLSIGVFRFGVGQFKRATWSLKQCCQIR